MSDAHTDERMVRNYLLGCLPDDETKRLDELIVTDDEVAETLRSVENDLVDSYVRGMLSEDELARFRSHYLVPPGHIERVQMARALLDYFTETAGSDAGVKAGSWNMSRVGRQWLAFAAVLVILASTYLLFENIRLRKQVEQDRTEFESLSLRERELQTQLDRQRASVSETEKELARVREQLARLQDTASQLPRQIAFHLSPPTRATTAGPSLAVPAGAEVVILNLELEAPRYPSYRAKLKFAEDPGNLWISDALERKGDFLEVRLPASKLNRRQNYLLEISGIAAGGEEVLTGYPFSVVTTKP